MCSAKCKAGFFGVLTPTKLYVLAVLASQQHVSDILSYGQVRSTLLLHHQLTFVGNCNCNRKLQCNALQRNEMQCGVVWYEIYIYIHLHIHIVFIYINIFISIQTYLYTVYIYIYKYTHISAYRRIYI